MASGCPGRVKPGCRGRRPRRRGGGRRRRRSRRRPGHRLARRRSRCCGPGTGLIRCPAAASAAVSMPGSTATTPSSACSRGASTAACTGSPRSTVLTMTCSSAERIRFEPAEPSTSSSSPSRRTRVGAIAEGSRLPGGAAKKPSGDRSCSPSMLFMCRPVPGTSTPEPSPLEVVAEAAQPSASSTETCVVEPTRLDRNRPAKPGSGRPAKNASSRASWIASIARTRVSASGRSGLPVQQRQRVAPAGCRRRSAVGWSPPRGPGSAPAPAPARPPGSRPGPAG